MTEKRSLHEEGERKRPLFLDTWWPISLVNVDAKDVSKAIATRMKNAQLNIIHHVQMNRFYIEERYISETVQ